MFACPLFREFREVDENAKLKGANYDTARRWGLQAVHGGLADAIANSLKIFMFLLDNNNYSTV